jgi:hypothetical protein
MKNKIVAKKLNRKYDSFNELARSKNTGLKVH